MPDLNLLTPKPSPTNILAPPTPIASLGPTPAPDAEPETRSFFDPAATRRYIYEDVQKAASGFKPLTDDKHTLRLSNVRYTDPDRFTRKQRKEAILTGGTLARRLKGTWELLDNATGQVIDSRDQVVANVPYYSSMGTIAFRGNEYTLNHQPRLEAGIFARRQRNGNIESHVNALPGKGVSHRYFLDPKRGLFKMKLAQSEMPIMPILRLLGATDKEMRANWGDELFASNYQEDDAIVLKKLKERLLSKRDREEGDDGSWRVKLVDAIKRTELNPEVTRATLGTPYANLDKDVMLAATKKLLAISKGEADVDDRDNLAYQRFFGPEDLLRERIERDHDRIQKQAFRQISYARSLKKMPSGLFTPQLEQALIGSGLGQAIEEINPAEVLDKQSRITRMGEGGIPSLDAIPDEARAVQPSHVGFVDPLRTPESFRVGVDLFMARSARKGRDGRVYTELLDNKTGKKVLRSPQQLVDSVIATSDAMKWPTKRVAAMKRGKLDYFSKQDVNFVIPHYENTFSPIGNLIPIKSEIKGQRDAMASRMLTQALPLANAEAPLVRGALPENEGRSFEEEYGSHMGAVRARQGGRVVGMDDGVLKLAYDDGAKDEVELYDHFPFNRKTFIHQTPLVQVGQMFKADQPLVRSNYTDDKGVTALGLNARVAYIPWRGYNFEDAVAVSESLARRMSSEHMYQHEVVASEKHKFGKGTFASLYPQKFDRKTLDRLDDRGVIRVGEKVDFGEPLILAVQEKDRAQNRIHKKRAPGYSDQSVVWKHHDPGIVTDVVWGKKGPSVVVKSLVPTQVGDKLSGRYGDKGVVAAIIPDAQMPHGEDGKPFELLLNSLGVISRTNPAQKIETWLGKVARHTGQPINVRDFEDIDDLTEWTKQKLQQYGLKDQETITHPGRGIKIPNVTTGDRFIMKLHHTAETKSQARDSGGYSMDEAPAKGGEAGCFLGGTMVECYRPGSTEIEKIDVAELVNGTVEACIPTRDPQTGQMIRGYVTDWLSYTYQAQDLLTVELENGEQLHVTPQHQFFLADGTTILAADLRPDMDLME